LNHIIILSGAGEAQNPTAIQNFLDTPSNPEVKRTLLT
jgi:hypothetical protein